MFQLYICVKGVKKCVNVRDWRSQRGRLRMRKGCIPLLLVLPISKILDPTPIQAQIVCLQV